MSIADRLEGKRVVICAGSGGVGKTTTSAALAMGLAARGAKVAVVTIDPAKRLADSLGLEDLDNEPRDRKSTRLNSSHANISYAVFCLKKKIFLFIDKTRKHHLLYT